MSKNIENLEITDTTVENEVNNSNERLEYNNLEIDDAPFIIDGELEEDAIQAGVYPEECLSIEDLRDLISESDDEEIPFTLDVDNLYKTEIDQKLFAKGVKSMSEIAGQIVALTTVGIDAKDALDVILNRETIKHNIDIAKINDVQDRHKKEMDSI